MKCLHDGCTEQPRLYSNYCFEHLPLMEVRHNDRAEQRAFMWMMAIAFAAVLATGATKLILWWYPS